MKIGEFIEKLKEFPQDASLELAKVLSVNPDEGGEAYEVRLDFPIIGLAMKTVNDKAEPDVCLVVEHHETILHFGKNITRLDEDGETQTVG